ncbi:hypothetical protein [Alteromonas ponticola]|uniref:Lipoprotein n=1 Tax=Alteromonas ponticola TaxID=2720613 RepID=A0ABX1QWW2_9ALTE|nr:hypothetical protein [Alteromonas ponticola]NMH58700.1 hypothetical protein [Alteromonas ponticola]
MKFLIVVGLILFLSSCATQLKNDFAGVGYACFEEPSDAISRSGVTSLCIFQLNRSSPFYDEQKRNKIVDDFIKSNDQGCGIEKQWELVSTGLKINHETSIIAYRVFCNERT